MIKGILFDYGGTIDTNGIHWGEVIWDIYLQHNIPIDKEVFKKAFSYGERTLAINLLILPGHSFLDMLNIKIACQFEYLVDNGWLSNTAGYQNEIKAIAAGSNSFAVAAINNAIPVLDELSRKYPMVLVSNFYGNIHSVLNNFGIINYFKAIIESAVAGVRKPDPKIFILGTEALQLSAAECVVVGDSYTKDIAPGSIAGCKTIWLKGKGWGDDPEDVSLASKVISDINQLPAAIAAL